MHSEKLKSFYLWSVKIPLFLVPLLPLLQSWSFLFPFIEIKYYAFRVLIEYAAVFWLGLMFLSKEYRPRITIILTALIFFTFITGLADLLGVNPYRSFWSDYKRMEGYVTILHLLLYFMMLITIIRSKKEFIQFLNIFSAAGAFVSLYALHHKLIEGWPYREYSTAGHASFLAAYMLMTVFVCLILMLNTSKRYLKAVYCFVIALNILTIYYSATRGAILAGLVGIIFFSLYFIFEKSKTYLHRHYKNTAIVVLVLAIIIPLFLVLFYKAPDISKGFDEFHDTLPRFATAGVDASITSRLDAWRLAWNGFKQRPLLGWGQENFVSLYMDHPFPFGKRVLMDRAHNIILDWMINAGLLGLLAYLSVLLSPVYIVWNLFKRKVIGKPETVMLTIAFAVYFIQNLFVFDTLLSYIIFFTLLAYVNQINDVTPAPVSDSTSFPRTLKYRSLCIVIVALTASSAATYFITYKPAKESYLTSQIVSSFKADKYRSFNDVLRDFKRALSFNTFGDTEVRSFMINISSGIINNRLFEVEGAVNFLKETSDEVEHLLEDNPNNINYWIDAVNLYNSIARYEPLYISRAESLIRKMIKISPQSQWSYFALADNYILKKDYEAALRTVQKRVAMDPHNDAMQVKLAITSLFVSRDDILNEALDNVRKIRGWESAGLNSGPDGSLSKDELILLAATAIDMGNFEKALRFYNQLIIIAPDVAQYRVGLAEIYLKLGNMDNAQKERRRAEELDPGILKGKAE